MIGGGYRKGGPIQLLKTVTNFNPGGTEGQIHNLVRHLDRSQFDVQFACLKKFGQFLSEVQEWNIAVEEFPISGFYRPDTFRQLLRLAHHMHKKRIEVAHSYNFYANVLAIPAARLAGVPLVLASVRDRGVYLTPAQKHVQKQACRMADGILVNADSIRDWLQDEGYPSDRIHVIKNGIDLDLYKDAKTDSDVSEQYGIPSGARLVIMVARLNAQKGIDELLLAAVPVFQELPDVHFLIVGEKLDFKANVIEVDTDYQKELEEKTVQLGIGSRVHFAGHRTDVPGLLALSSLSVLPSYSEGLSNTILESMAAGRAIVATRVGGNPELVQDGVNGLLIPPRDPEALASAITRILSDPGMAERFGSESLRIARTRHSMTGMVGATEALYTSLLEAEACKNRLRRAR